MSLDPRLPRTLRGALVSVDTMKLPIVTVFQYNPDSVKRTLAARTPQGAAGGAGGRLSATRLNGAPEERIELDVEVDATDQLAASNPQAMQLGIYPQLSALEMLVYPSSVAVIANTVLMAVGTVELLPPPAPLTLLIWGVKRIVPVRLEAFTITEEAHDPALNPIRARVSLGLRVLSYEDLSITNPGYYVFLAHQVVKEGMAALGTVNDLTAVAGQNVKLL